MTNRNSKQHGLVGNIRPKSNVSKRARKVKARERAITRQDALKEALKQGN